MREGAKPYRRSYWRRALNGLVRPLARLGLAGPRTHLLTVPGRKTGQLWSTPVSIVEQEGQPARQPSGVLARLRLLHGAPLRGPKLGFHLRL